MISCPICQYANRPAARLCAGCRAPLVLQGKYRITRLLGRGGFGAVYQAAHTGLGGAVYAIKESFPDPYATPAQLQAASDQFRLEASILAKLNHSALPKVMDFFTEGNRDYLVMEYVEGETLEERLARNGGSLPEAQVLVWADELCDVLTYLHTRQPMPVIHRDVKPSNVKIMPDGRLRLFDFGIAKHLAAGVGTASAARAVSPPYSPMEQYGGGTDARSDIYALGVTLYELLTAHLPPDAPDRASNALVPPQNINPGLSPEFQAVILRAMAEKPSGRFQSTLEVKQALRMLVPAPEQLQMLGNQPGPYGQSISARGYSGTSSERTLGIMALFSATILVLFLVGWGAFSIQQDRIRQANASETAHAEAVLTTKAAAAATVQAEATLSAQADATATFQAEATRTAEAAATATVIAEATLTAQANARATTQAAYTHVVSLTLLASRSFGPSDGTLTHPEDATQLPNSYATGSYRNFVAEARFYNPYPRSVASWDYGFGFRSTEGNQQYRWTVDSDGDWDLRLISGTNSDGTLGTRQLGHGTFDEFDVSPNGSNTLRIVVDDAVAYLFINAQYVATLDVSDKDVAGSVWVGTVFFTGHRISGKVTRYDGFTVWSLPEGSTP